jgi:hypothetical protein
MKLTNVHKIPETFVNVLKRPTYSKGKANLSATQLLNSPKIVALTKKFEEELEQDVSDMVWSIFGTAIHGVLEHGKDDNHIVEERLHAEVGGWNISGAVDLQIVTGENVISIRDYKTTSAWAVMNEKIEWEQQLNIYAWLVERNKRVVVDSLGIVAIIRDWSRREAAKNEDYPQAPSQGACPSNYGHIKEREEFIENRLWLIPRLSLPWMLNEALPDCTPSEMWEKPSIWAVRKVGNVRAKSLHNTEEEANAALEAAGKGFEIEYRPGERTRCASFCPVSNWCQQWRNFQEQQ